MKIKKTIKVPVMGGGFNTKTEIETDEFRGEKLGTSLNGSEEIFTEAVSHIESIDETTMTFTEIGTVKKSFIKALVWHKDNYSNEVAYVRLAAHNLN